ncbi:MAG TPA: glutamine--fructose-6-phosphate transaminase (isomerizing) [Planctomycetota bacterium]|nr:glutamine--fructose-6-phosphate transaminase (isomerizing) [Planctomycetota bacterium]
MCGIIGCVGRTPAAAIVLDGLQALEYRGYDSAGLAVLDGDKLLVERVSGRIADLRARLAGRRLPGTTAIGHTRWATHGMPSEANAHPHADCAGRVAVVHNGIIENHRALRRALEADGHKFSSETDSEVLAHLVERSLAGGADLPSALRRAMREIEGSAAVACISADSPGVIVAARRGSPLAIGVSEGRQFVASDALPIVEHTRRVIYLEDDELAVLASDRVELFDRDGLPVPRSPTVIVWNAVAIQKEGYAHFMLKEIHEQPRAIEDTLRGRVAPGLIGVEFGEELPAGLLAGMQRMVIVGMGTSWHAGLIGRNMIERLARLPVQVDYAADFRYRDPVIDEHTLVLAISQSGETADTLEAVRLAKSLGVRTAVIANVVDSSLAREADGVLYTRAGPEVGVASTKAFTSQITALCMLAIRLGLERGALAKAEAVRRINDLCATGGELRKVLDTGAAVERLAGKYAQARDFLFLGRGAGYPLALEGALKLKEVAYIHAEGYHAAEMKHGPIALVDANMPVLFLALKGRRYEKIMSNIQEIRARGGRVIAVASLGDEEIVNQADDVLYVPDEVGMMNAVLATVPLQLLAYHVAVARGCDVDRPRNLAKSVTVE